MLNENTLAPFDALRAQENSVKTMNGKNRNKSKEKIIKNKKYSSNKKKI